MIENIRHTGIVVNDLEKSLIFYRDLLGFKIIKQMNEGGQYLDMVLGLEKTKVTTIKMSAPNGEMIELLFYFFPGGEKKAYEICDVGISHIAFSVRDLDATYEKLIQTGIEFISTPQVSPDGFAKVAFCKAPEGTFVELVQEL
jgi:catechol 2,3-dioxygenase-like lactoylglutathione lyase family enzyme